MSRCPECPGQNLCIGPDGPKSPRGGVLFVGEAPGATENKKNRVFIGRTGEEVDGQYLPLAGLKRNAVTFCNAIQCLPISAGGKLDPKQAKDISLLQSCANHALYPLIEKMKPRVIVPMGNFACRAILDGAFDLIIGHGFPVDTIWNIPAFPMYHPALGLHSPKEMIYIRTDWIRLGQFLRNTLRLPHDDVDEPDYAEATQASHILDIDPTQPLAGDTEFGREGAYCLTYTQRPGFGRLIRAERRDLLRVLQTRLDQYRAPILFHNWLADWPYCTEMGLSLPHRHLVDTMALVYHLGNLPQGLKALSRRELGMEMQDFDDLVRPYSREEVLLYYRRMTLETWEKPEAQAVRDKSGKWKLYKPHSMATKLKTFFTHLAKDPNKDVFEAWSNWEEEHAEIQARCGPWPGIDISHVPFEHIIAYACRDVDALIRLYPILRHMASRVRKSPQHQWREHGTRHRRPSRSHGRSVAQALGRRHAHDRADRHHHSSGGY